MEKLKFTSNKNSDNQTKNFYSIDIFPQDHKFENLDCIVFKNYYTSTISIKTFNSNDEGVILLENYKLMDDPDFDDEGEKYHVIYKNQVRV